MSILTVFECASTEIRAICVEKKGDDFSFLAFASVSVDCLKNGLITNVSVFEEAIKKIRNELDSKLVRPIDGIVLSVVGLKSVSRLKVFQKDYPTSRVIVRSDLLDVLKSQPLEEDDIRLIHCLPIRYKVDNRLDVENPEGLIASHFTMACHLVGVPSSAFLMYEYSFKRLGLKIDQWIAPSFAISRFALSDALKKEGVLLMDFGRQETQMAVWNQRVPVFLSSFPLGSSLISKDIQKAFSLTSFSEAEELKEKHGRAWVLSEDHLRHISVGGVSRSLLDLTRITHSRVREIFELLRLHLLSKSNLEGISRLVLVGQGAQMPYLKELIENVFHRSVQILPSYSWKGHFISPVLVGCFLLRFEALQSQNPVLSQERETTLKTMRSLIKDYL